MSVSDRQHGSRAGGQLHMFVRGDGLQEGPGNVPSSAGEQGCWTAVTPSGLALCNGCPC